MQSTQQKYSKHIQNKDIAATKVIFIGNKTSETLSNIFIKTCISLFRKFLHFKGKTACKDTITSIQNK